MALSSRLTGSRHHRPKIQPPKALQLSVINLTLTTTRLRPSNIITRITDINGDDQDGSDWLPIHESAPGQSETNVTAEPWSAVEWIADADLTRASFYWDWVPHCRNPPSTSHSSRPSNSMLGLRPTTP